MGEARSTGSGDEGMSAVRRLGPYLLLVAGALLFGGGLRYHLHFREVPAAGGAVGSGIAWLHGAFGLVPVLLLSALLVGWAATMIQPGKLRVDRAWTCAYAVIFVCFASGLAGVWDAGGTLGQIVGGGVRDVVGTVASIGLLGAGSWLSLGLATDRWSFGRSRVAEELEEALPATLGGAVASSPADGMMPPRAGAETAPPPARAHGTAVPQILRTVVAPNEEDVAKTLQMDAPGSFHGGGEDAAVAVLDAPVLDAPSALVDVERSPAPASGDERLSGLDELDPERFIPELILESASAPAAESAPSSTFDLVVSELDASPAALAVPASPGIETTLEVAAGDEDDDVDFGDDDEDDDGDDEEDEDWDDDEDEDWDDDEEDEDEEEEEEAEEEGGGWDDAEEADDSDAGDDEEEEEDDDWDDDDDEDDEDEDEDDEEDDDEDDDDDDWEEDGGGDGDEWNAAPADPSHTTEIAPAARRGGAPGLTIPAAAGESDAGADYVLAPAARLEDPRPESLARPNAPRTNGPSILPAEDPRFERAVELVLGCRRAAPSLLQRRMMLDFPTATRFLEAMESQGLIGPARGGLEREIRVSLDDYRQRR